MNLPLNTNPNPDGMQESSAETNEIIQAHQEELRIAKKEALLEKNKRQQLQENLRKSASTALTSLETRKKQEEQTIRLIRNGLASEIEQVVSQLKSELSKLKTKGELSKKSEQDFCIFHSSCNAYIEKKKYLEQLEKNLDVLRKEIQAGQTKPENEASFNKTLEAARQINEELRKFIEKLLLTYEKLEIQIQQDTHQEEVFHTAFITCLNCLPENQQREINAHFQIKFKTAPLDTKIAFYKATIESLVKTHPNIAFQLHSFIRKNAKEYLKQKQFDQAISELGYALHLEKDNPKTLKLLASAFLAKGERNKALTILQETIRLDPNDVELRKTIASEWLKANNFAHAIQEYETIIDQCPSDKESRCRLANTYFHQNNYSKTIEILAETVPAHEMNIETQRVLALSYVYTHEYKKAIPLLVFLNQNDPQNEEILKHLTISYRKTGNHPAAIELLNRHFLESPERSLTLYILLAASYEESGDLVKAEQIYAQLITQNPSKTHTLLFHLAHIQNQLGKTDEAILSYSQALQDDRFNAKIILPLSTLLRRKEKTEEAQKLLESAFEKDPSNVDLKQELSMIYIETGQFEKAQAFMQK